jgi:Protein of unknown function (DUF3105)
MAKKRKRRPPRPVPATQAAPAPVDVAPRGGANVARRERKEEARRLREAERRRARRASALRRTVTSVGIAAVAVAGITVFRSLSGPNEVPQAALSAAQRAGCGDIEHRENLTPPGDPHLGPGETIQYPDPPATSGKHNPSPPNDEPKVFTEPFEETVAVHGLEHGAVFVYYMPEEQGGIAAAVVERLAGVVQASNATYLAPHPSLSAETALTMVAWNYRWQCPAADGEGTPLSPEAAVSIVNGFRTGYECTGEAPENGAAPC